MKGLVWTTDKTLTPKRLVRRYQWEAPPGHESMSTSNSLPGLSGSKPPHHRRPSSRLSEVAGLRKVHVAMTDATPPGPTSGVLADEGRKETTLDSWGGARAVRWFSEQGSPVGGSSQTRPSLRSGDWRKSCRALDLKPIRTKSYTRRPREGRTFHQNASWRNGLT